MVDDTVPCLWIDPQLGIGGHLVPRDPLTRATAELIDEGLDVLRPLLIVRHGRASFERERLCRREVSIALRVPTPDADHVDDRH